MRKARTISIGLIVIAVAAIYPTYLFLHAIDEGHWWNERRPPLANQLAAEETLVMFINNGFDDVFDPYREAENIAMGTDFGRRWIIADMPEFNEIRGLIVSPDGPDSAVAFAVDLRRNLSTVLLSDRTATRHDTASGLLSTLRAVSPQAADHVADRIDRVER